MEKQQHYKAFLLIAAICSFAGALTTILLLFLPNPEATDFASQVALSQNHRYLFKLWTLFVHPQVNFIASLGIAWLLFKKNPAKILIGTLFLLVWAYTEMSQQALLIDGLNMIWRPAYQTAENEMDAQMYQTLITGASGISSSKYFLVIYGFGIGSFLYGLAFIPESGLSKWLGGALLFIGLLSLASFARYYLGFQGLSPIVNWCYEWIYPYLQPIVRIGIGVWILSKIRTKEFLLQRYIDKISLS